MLDRDAYAVAVDDVGRNCYIHTTTATTSITTTNYDDAEDEDEVGGIAGEGKIKCIGYYGVVYVLYMDVLRSSSFE